jgi:hypothetical protein
MELSIKGLKTFRGEEGLAFRCTVLVDGKAGFAASNDGNGGANFYTPASGQTWGPLREAEAWAKAQPPRRWDLFGDGREVELECDLDALVSDLIDKELERRWLAAQCKGKTLFRLPEAKPGEWLVLRTPFCPDVKAQVLERNPGAVFGNEMV